MTVRNRYPLPLMDTAIRSPSRRYHLHQAGPAERLPLGEDQGGRRVEDGVQHAHGTLGVPGHAVRAYQCARRLPDPGERRPGGHDKQICFCLSRRHPHLLPGHSVSPGSRQEGPPTPPGESPVRKGGEMRLSCTSTTFLGYIISAGSIAMDPEKVRMVEQWPNPATGRASSASLGSPTSTGGSSGGSAPSPHPSPG